MGWHFASPQSADCSKINGLWDPSVLSEDPEHSHADDYFPRDTQRVAPRSPGFPDAALTRDSPDACCCGVVRHGCWPHFHAALAVPYSGSADDPHCVESPEGEPLRGSLRDCPCGGQPHFCKCSGGGPAGDPYCARSFAGEPLRGSLRDCPCG